MTFDYDAPVLEVKAGHPGESIGPLLQVRALRKVFGGNVALSAAHLTVQPGEIHALLGENGAGKSTLIRCLAGIFPPDGGEILLQGDPLTVAAVKAGAIAFIHQEMGLIEDLSIAENIAFSTGYVRRFGMIDWPGVRETAVEALRSMAMDLDPSILVAELPQATRTAVAIARAVATKAQVVVLDEPTATLSALEVDVLFNRLRQLRQSGVGIVFVTHRLDEVFSICDQVTVLRDGETVLASQTSALSHDDLVRAITGHAPHSSLAGPRAEASSAVTCLRGQDLKGAFVGPVSFEIGAGEIVGMTGLTDGGHYQIGAMLFGLQPILEGQLELQGNPYAPRNPREAISKGVGYVPPDRNDNGLAAEMSVTENLFLNPTPSNAISGLGRLISRRAEHSAASGLLQTFGVKPAQPGLAISALSGGNAQKVLVARWLSDPPPVMVLNDLTFGVDIGARQEIYETILKVVSTGTTVVVITSDFEEIETLCTRAYVLSRGRISGELVGPELTTSSMTALAVSGRGA